MLNLKSFKMLIFISLFISGYSKLRESNFKLIKNAQVSFNFDKFNLLGSYSFKNRIDCLAKCNQMANTCMMVISNRSSSCLLYRSSVSLKETVSSANKEIRLFKKLENNCSSHQFYDGISCCKF
jgi:hypothetical protein